MNIEPRVTVILTSYNHEPFIRQSTESVLNQTFSDFELIIADDCSSDASWDIINSFKDVRIKLFRSEKTERGLINKVLRSGMGSGGYVAIHHSDDVWEPTKLEKQVGILDANPKVGAVFCRAKIIDAEGNILKSTGGQNPTVDAYMRIFCQENRSREEWLRHFFYHGNCLCHPSLLIRSDCYRDLGLYNMLYRQLPDFDYWIRLCRKYEMHILEEELLQFRVIGNKGNTSSVTPESWKRRSYEFLRILKHFADLSDVDEILKIFPEAKKYTGLVSSNPGFLLSMVAINSPSMEANLFGMQLLGEMMESQDFRESCQKLHGFRIDDFHALIGSSNAVSIFDSQFNEHLHRVKTLQLEEIIQRLNAEVSMANGKISEITRELSNSLQKIESIHNSKSWKITKPLRSIQHFLER